MNKDYYIINNQNLANALTYLTGVIPFRYDDKYNKGKKIYSFKITEEFKKALIK